MYQVKTILKGLILAASVSVAVAQTPIPDSMIGETGVTQHEAALTITESQISDLAHTVDTNTNAQTECSGTDNYLDGEGNCDALTTNATHTGDVTGDTALTITADAVSADELDEAGVESGLEAVLDLEDLQGAVTDGQIPATIARDSELHDAVTETDSAEIDFTLTGQDITAALVAGSIDESKLDTSVNNSLDDADSAVQPGDNVSDLTNDAGYLTSGDGDGVYGGSGTLSGDTTVQTAANTFEIDGSSNTQFSINTTASQLFSPDGSEELEVSDSGVEVTATNFLFNGFDILTDIVSDPSPQLGGNLDWNGYSAVGEALFEYTSGIQTAFEVDASSSSIDTSPAFKIRLPTTGDRKAFQATNGSDIYAWASFEYEIGGSGKPGFALGEGGVSARDTNIYRDSANVLKTDDAFYAVGNISTDGTVDGRDVASDGTTLDNRGNYLQTGNSDTSTTLDASTSWVAAPIFGSVRSSNGSDFTLTSSTVVTVNFTGAVRLSTTAYMGCTGQRAAPEIRFYNGGAAFGPVAGSYARNANSHDATSSTIAAFITDVTSGDTIELRIRSGSTTTGTCTFSGGNVAQVLFERVN